MKKVIRLLAFLALVGFGGVAQDTDDFGIDGVPLTQAEMDATSGGNVDDFYESLRKQSMGGSEASVSNLRNALVKTNSADTVNELNQNIKEGKEFHGLAQYPKTYNPRGGAGPGSYIDPSSGYGIPFSKKTKAEISSKAWLKTGEILGTALAVAAGIGGRGKVGEPMGPNEMASFNERSMGSGPIPLAAGSGAKAARSLYKDVTDAGSRLPNRATNVSPKNFIDNLTDSGFAKTVSKDGKAISLSKGNTTYSLYQKATSTEGPSALMFVDGQKVLKIRLGVTK